jgi:serine/threonine protein kinase
LHAYFSEAGEFYLVQDWIEGKSLAQKVREEGRLDEGEAREFLTSILPVLEFVHSQGVIHRDISPNNVMIRQRDGKPVLIDFGAVKEIVSTILDADGYPSSTMVIGSPGYMPLEQQAGRPIFASDIFSLGLTTIFSLTGRYPQQLHDLRTGDISWREHAPEVTKGLAEVLDKAVENYAHNRFISARQMLEALSSVNSPLPVEGREPRVYKLSKDTGGTSSSEAATQLSEETVLHRSSDSYGITSVLITEPTLLIRINQNYREGMSAAALYDATRGVWRIGPRRERAQYAMAVFRGVVREVYAIEGWHHAGTTHYETCDATNMRVPGRWEFTGRLAPEEVREKYVGRSVADYFKQGMQSPVVYINC